MCFKALRISLKGKSHVFLLLFFFQLGLHFCSFSHRFCLVTPTKSAAEIFKYISITKKPGAIQNFLGENNPDFLKYHLLLCRQLFFGLYSERLNFASQQVKQGLVNWNRKQQKVTYRSCITWNLIWPTNSVPSVKDIQLLLQTNELYTLLFKWLVSFSVCLIVCFAFRDLIY